MKTNPWIAYVDGAYSDKYPTYVSAAFVLIDQNSNRRWKYTRCIENEILAASRNAGAEILAAYLATKLASMLGCNRLIIYYDYVGVSCWVLGHWKANKPMTQIYKSQMRQFIDDGLQIDFRHIKAHSGNAWNDYVDYLAGYELMKLERKDNNVSTCIQTE